MSPSKNEGNRQSGKPGPEILEHWYTLIPSVQFSSSSFYSEIEAEIQAQKIPSLDIARVEISEGGFLSDNREYLRMKRERLIFDVCAAPVGINYFFSYRFYVEEVKVKPWQITILVAALWILLEVCLKYIGLILGPVLLVSALLIIGWTMRNSIGLGLQDLDATLLKLPIIGPVYERFFRKDTYYRQDLRIAYCSIASAIVKQKVEAITAAKGVKLLKELKYSPGMDDIYVTRIVKPDDSSKPQENAID